MRAAPWRWRRPAAEPRRRRRARGVPALTARALASRYAALAAVLALGCAGDASGPRDLQLSILAGDAQSAAAGSAVATEPTVLVHDDRGAPRAGVVVTFRVSVGGGWVAPETDTTDGGGRASTAWILGPRAGDANRLVAELAAGASTAFTATATPLEPGRTLFGRAGYIEMVAGDLPLIIAAPHGGALAPSAIPDRTVGESVRDTNTEELARAIHAAFLSASGRAPHLIINRLHRRKLDANREIVEAAAGNADAEHAWREFHSFIEAAREAAVADHGAGFFIDLHGHGHPVARLELGYLLTGVELAQPDDVLAQASWAERTSIRALVVATGRPLPELLRGSTGLGGLFAAEGYPSVPSPASPHPEGEPYFSGGYNTERHGSRERGTVSGVQIEAHFAGVRDHAASRDAFARALVRVLDRWFAAHYGRALLGPPAGARAGADHLSQRRAGPIVPETSAREPAPRTSGAKSVPARRTGVRVPRGRRPARTVPAGHPRGSHDSPVWTSERPHQK